MSNDIKGFIPTRERGLKDKRTLQYEFRWSKSKASLWKHYTPPSRPSRSEIAVYQKEFINRFGGLRGLRVLILGSTCEFREFFDSNGCKVTVVDKSQEYYNEISNEWDEKKRKTIMAHEKVEFKFWHNIESDNKYDVIIGDLAIGNVCPENLKKFIRSMYRALKPGGVFIGKNMFTGVVYNMSSIEDLCSRYESLDSCDPYEYFMYPLSIKHLMADNSVDFHEMYEEVKSLRTIGKISESVFSNFQAKQLDSHMDIKFYCYNYVDFCSRMKEAGFGNYESRESQDIYTQYFPIYIFEKNNIEIDEKYKSRCASYKTQMRNRVVTYLGDLSEKDILFYSESVGSQYFILGVLKLSGIDFSNKDVKPLVDEIKRTCKRNLRIDITDDLLISAEYYDETIAKENEKLVAEAKAISPNVNINADKILRNYLTSICVYIFTYVSTQESDIIEILLKKLFANESFDKRNNWHPSTMPWVTARALLSLSNQYFREVQEELCELNKNNATSRLIVNRKRTIENETSHINGAVNFLLSSVIVENDRYLGWREGVNNWVKKEESDALCMEALFNYYNGNEQIRDVLCQLVSEYLRNEKLKDILKELREYDENDISLVLPWVVLSSVIVQIIDGLSLSYSAEYFLLLDALNTFSKSYCRRISLINSQGQKSAEAQLLYYLYRAGQKPKLNCK